LFVLKIIIKSFFFIKIKQLLVAQYVRVLTPEPGASILGGNSPSTAVSTVPSAI